MTEALAAEIAAGREALGPKKPKTTTVLPGPLPEDVGRDIAIGGTEPIKVGGDDIGPELTSLVRRLAEQVQILQKQVEGLPIDPDVRPKAAYRAYCEATNFKSSSGTRLVDWHDLDETRKKAWHAAVNANP